MLFLEKNIMPKFLKFLSLALSGALIIIICSLLQDLPTPAHGEYFLTEFLSRNYTTYLTPFVFCLGGVAAGYFIRINPWLTGLFMISVFPLTSIYEASVYRGSHNLIPFEFILHFVFSLPAVAGAYAGKYLIKFFPGKNRIINN
jgi:hypothetical protein